MGSCFDVCLLFVTRKKTLTTEKENSMEMGHYQRFRVWVSTDGTTGGEGRVSGGHRKDPGVRVPEMPGWGHFRKSCEFWPLQNQNSDPSADPMQAINPPTPTMDGTLRTESPYTCMLIQMKLECRPRRSARWASDESRALRKALQAEQDWVRAILRLRGVWLLQQINQLSRNCSSTSSSSTTTTTSRTRVKRCRFCRHRHRGKGLFTPRTHATRKTPRFRGHQREHQRRRIEYPRTIAAFPFLWPV